MNSWMRHKELFVEEETTGPLQMLHIDFAGPFQGKN